MATARKHWFRVADSVLWEGWSDAELATMIRLQAYLNTRWARDGLSPEEACQATLSIESARLICKRTHRADCERALRALGARLTLSVEVVGECFEIKWPKWAEFQNIAPRRSPEGRPGISLSETPPPPPPQKRETAAAVSLPKPARAPRGGDKTPAPDRLTPEERAALARWCGRPVEQDGLGRPDLLPRLLALEAACLTHHRAKGNRHASWYATAQTWIRNEADGRYGTPRISAAVGGGDDLTQRALAELERQDRNRELALTSPATPTRRPTR